MITSARRTLLKEVAPGTGTAVLQPLMRTIRSTLLVVLLAVLAQSAADAEGGALRDAIDRDVKAAWVENGIAPPECSSDSVFLRRVHLDLVGMIPSYE